jgi:hypothetical protein
MGWLLSLAVFGALFWMVRRSRERAEEYAASGMLYSPAYLGALILSSSLVILSVYMATLGAAHIPVGLWLLAAAMVVVLLILRQWLKRRFPY